MLVLTRKATQVITIGDGILVEIIGIDGDQVKVGVQAPPWVPVDRAEVRARKEADGAIQELRDKYRHLLRDGGRAG
jgi:carbon storage regulator